jgi:hypothetical protein
VRSADVLLERERSPVEAFRRCARSIGDDADMQQRSFYERAMFWVTFAGVVVVCGSVLTGVGLALRGSSESVWSQPWFDAGLAVLAAGLLAGVVAVRHYFAEHGRTFTAGLVWTWQRLRTVTRAAARRSPVVLHSPVEWRGRPNRPRRHSPIDDGTTRIDITYAAYEPEGAGLGQGVDVTERVRDLVRGGATAFLADNASIMGAVENDPFPGRPKRLHIMDSRPRRTGSAGLSRRLRPPAPRTRTRPPSRW